ncbi:hypothetical protein [Paraburkholderia sp. BCC1885]|uniref:hypothetical protein n=1 Tax=Paraburkholderia sp. BCC1885 TaxID=2562669 RepID=UPI0011843426|nr:hypothetical protein [Paraburkholderia sp. BCC1885]
MIGHRFTTLRVTQNDLSLRRFDRRLPVHHRGVRGDLADRFLTAPSRRVGRISHAFPVARRIAPPSRPGSLTTPKREISDNDLATLPLTP